MLSSASRVEITFKRYGLKTALWSNDTPLDAAFKRGVFKSGEKKYHQNKDGPGYTSIAELAELVLRSGDVTKGTKRSASTHPVRQVELKPTQ